MASGFTSGLRGTTEMISTPEVSDSPAQAMPDAIKNKATTLGSNGHFIRELS